MAYLRISSPTHLATPVVMRIASEPTLISNSTISQNLFGCQTFTQHLPAVSRSLPLVAMAVVPLHLVVLATVMNENYE